MQRLVPLRSAPVLWCRTTIYNRRQPLLKSKALLRSILLVSLLAPALSACGGDTPPTPTAVPTSPPTVALPPNPTPTVAPPAAAPDVTLAEGDAGTLAGLPMGVFRNSQTKAAQQGLPRQVLPHQGQIRSTDLPNTRELGAPRWVRPGTRITFYAAAATVVSRGEPKCKEDPNGEWEDDNGNKYSCTGMPGDPDGSSAGEGLSQVDVLAVEGTDVVLSTTLYSFDRTARQYTVAPLGGGKAPGDVIDEVWIHPTRLAEIAESNLEGMRILRGNYEVEGTTYKAISFVSIKPGSYHSYAYDTETGLLIAATTRTTPSTTLLAPPQTAASGNAQLYVRRLLGYRQRNVPGLTGTNPTWVARTKQLNYSGTWNFVNPIGSNPNEAMVFPMYLSVTLGRGGRNWVPFTSKSAIHFSSAQESTGTGVTGSGGQFWIDPRALSRLRRGQVVDEDPYTQETLAVESVSSGSGVKIVSISSELPGNRSLFTYDLNTGALVDFQTSSRGSGITILLRLQNPPS